MYDFSGREAAAELSQRGLALVTFVLSVKLRPTKEERAESLECFDAFACGNLYEKHVADDLFLVSKLRQSEDVHGPLPPSL